MIFHVHNSSKNVVNIRAKEMAVRMDGVSFYDEDQKHIACVAFSEIDHITLSGDDEGLSPEIFGDFPWKN